MFNFRVYHARYALLAGKTTRKTILNLNGTHTNSGPTVFLCHHPLVASQVVRFLSACCASECFLAPTLQSLPSLLIILFFLWYFYSVITFLFLFYFSFFHLSFLRTLFLRYQGCPLRIFLIADVELRLLCGLLLRCPPLCFSRAGSLSSVSPAFVGGVLQALLHTGILWECVIGFCLFWIIEGCLSCAWGILSLFPITENSSEHLSGCRCLCGALVTRYLLLGCWMMELLPRLIIISRSEGLHSHMRLGCSAYLMKFGE